MLVIMFASVDTCRDCASSFSSTGVISTVPGPGHPFSLCFSHKRDCLYVVDFRAKSVHKICCSTGMYKHLYAHLACETHIFDLTHAQFKFLHWELTFSLWRWYDHRCGKWYWNPCCTFLSQLCCHWWWAWYTSFLRWRRQYYQESTSFMFVHNILTYY